MAENLQNMDESQKYDYMVQLYHEINDYFLHRYMKLSHNHMDEKIAVLEARKNGVSPVDIPNWNEVQEID